MSVEEIERLCLGLLRSAFEERGIRGTRSIQGVMVFVQSRLVLVNVVLRCRIWTCGAVAAPSVSTFQQDTRSFADLDHSSPFYPTVDRCIL